MRRAAQRFQVIIERGEDGYFIARVPALPGCMTQARTYEQLLRRATEAIELCLDVARGDRRQRRRYGRRSHRSCFIGVDEVMVRA